MTTTNHKILALFLILLMSANTVFASQMMAQMAAVVTVDMTTDMSINITTDIATNTTSIMASNPHKMAMMQPCHGNDSHTKTTQYAQQDNHPVTHSDAHSNKPSCCDNGCTTCVSGSISSVSVLIVGIHIDHSLPQIKIDNHLAEKHAATLYRPPIFI